MSTTDLNRRALHFVFKIGNRGKAIKFFKDVLGMTVLRHEEFEEGCKATCNGPYDGKWSKTMIGYGCEDDHFVIELTYNYGVGSYKLGNDFLGITIQDSSILTNAKRQLWPIEQCDDDVSLLLAPDGHKFYITNAPRPSDGADPLQRVTLSSTDMERSVEYWSETLDMKIHEKGGDRTLLGYGDSQCKLELRSRSSHSGVKLDRGTAFGRIAFACPSKQLSGIEASIVSKQHKVLTPLVSLDTPGKATVQVVILADPDGHEICFVGDESFRQLSRIDPKADDLLAEAMSQDHSDEWFAKKGKSKAEAAVAE